MAVICTFRTLKQEQILTESPGRKSACVHGSELGSFSKRRRQQQEHHQTKGFTSKTIAVHVRFESLYISLPSFAKQQREMAQFYVFGRMRTAMANFWYLL